MLTTEMFNVHEASCLADEGKIQKLQVQRQFYHEEHEEHEEEKL